MPNPSIIPLPSTVQLGAGSLSLPAVIRVYDPAGTPASRWVVDHAGGELTLDPTTACIRFELGSAFEAEEAYHLVISRDGVQVNASHPAGLLRAAATLVQLLHADSAKLPILVITDQPRFGWRGLLLDCSRHFMPVELILRLLDVMALHKLNVLHWHLVDDQGWRLQIDRWPLLTEVGAWRETEGGRYGGFYTKEDVRRIVTRAAELGIRVIPEIELPGHSSAVLAAYPNLGCRGVQAPVPNRWGVFKDILCGGRDESLHFLRDVLTEVTELFPDECVHIGGDEAPRDRWKECPHCQQRIRTLGLRDEAHLQTWMTEQVRLFLAERGRRIVGWDELQYGGLPPASILQHWRFPECLQGALDAGHEVVLSPNRFLYFDYPHDKDPHLYSRDTQRPDWMPALPLEKVYSLEPIDSFVPAAKAHLIRGLECTAWSEFIPPSRLSTQLFPRICAMAEVAWSPAKARSWEDFRNRLHPHLGMLRAKGWPSYDGPMAPMDWQQIHPAESVQSS
jgi:hexosaminidase